MENRQPTRPGRIKLTDDSGNSQYYTMERADEPITEGTPLNKATLFDSTNSERYACDVPSEAFGLLTKEWLVNIPVENWSSIPNTDGWFTNQVTVAGMKEKYNPFCNLQITSAELAEDEVASMGQIQEIETFDGYIVAKALDVPELSLNVKLMGV